MRHRTFCGMLPVLFVLTFVVFVQGQGVTQNKADRIPSLSGLIFTDNLLFSQAVVSTVACAKLCLKTETCTTFTHRKATPTTLSACRGHSGYFTAISPGENIAGTGVYHFREIEAAVIETTPEITALAETTAQANWLLAE
ncbi:hypothetical protein V1264_015669 [Littorina saxatilis]|uniref:Apple domain-containing protein n=1 Tax=Littorina saxatilis TaxID=31220 RepID=A0AAN9BM81_9CAEN